MDIGRVVLINNSFYAISEKSKQQLNNYTPTLRASKKNQKTLKDKIFQPLFTTKPTDREPVWV